MQTLKDRESHKTVSFNALQPDATRRSIAGTPVDLTAFGTRFYGFSLNNGDAATRYLQVFFKPAAAVTLGVTPYDLVYLLPSSGTREVEYEQPKQGLGQSAGLSVAVTTTETGATGATVGSTGQFYLSRE